ncbi:hypothetical protein REPUB_Repub03eG0036900 [Reevesia pubescens]
MAIFSLNIQPSYHSRSNSLPSRQHPIASQIDEKLSRLRGSEAASTSSLIGYNLNGLQDLHEYVDMCFNCPTQQTLAQEQDLKWVEELLDGSLMILDVCSTAKDGPDAESKLCRWSLVSKLMHQKRVGYMEEGQKTNEIANAEATIRSLIKSDNIKHIENVQSELQKCCAFKILKKDLKASLDVGSKLESLFSTSSTVNCRFQLYINDKLPVYIY